ncbi:hypothetical protein [Sphingomonas sp. LH128]|uniref:hypothetical protein n=1 Tax=Sphingomonas sp. LH128 TaxID=473781 RepID=UPI00155E3DE3|nr:hypothetical protein [Sphingomonas sp. LH128]
MIHLARAWLPTAKGRLTLAFIFIGSLIIALDPQFNSSAAIDWKKVVPCFLAGLAWLWSELSEVVHVSQHDRDLYATITATLNQDALTFLGTHDFQIDLPISATNPIAEVSYWHGAQYEFNDPTLQKRWEAVYAKICSLSDTYGSNLVDAPNNPNALTAWHLDIPRHQQPAKAHEEIAELNAGGIDVYRAVNAFMKFARMRLGL